MSQLKLKNINLKQIKLVKEVVDSLNEAFPAPKVKTQIRHTDNSLSTVNKQLDNYFYAYFERQIDLEDIWWIVCIDYWVWNESMEYLNDFCRVLKSELKIKVNNCNVHPVYMHNLQERHNEKKLYLIGKCNWF